MTALRGHDRELGVVTSVIGDQVVLTVNGDIDLSSAPRLAAALDDAIGRGHRSVALDLAALDFMSIAGLRLIAGATERLAASGGELAIRTAPTHVRRMLDITGLGACVRLEDGHPSATRPGPEAAGPVSVLQDIDAVSPASAVSPAGALRRITALPAGDDVVEGIVHLVVALARATVGGADGVSVSLRRHGSLATVAASDQTISAMDADQYATGEGPCVDASRTGGWFHTASLADELRWPAFSPLARTLGINAIFSAPLVAHDQPVGSLNIYSRATGAFAVADQELAMAFAHQASIVLTAVGVGLSDDRLSRRLAEALRTREIIAQAVGVVMERQGVGEEEAYTNLRRTSQRTSQPLRARAQEIVSSTRRPLPAPP